jgi:hypothetical protein
MNDYIQVAELAAYIALRLRSEGKDDAAVNAEIKAITSTATTPQGMVDALLAKARTDQTALDQKIDQLPEPAAPATS